MALSNDLISQFVKATSDSDNEKKETVVYGTIKKQSNSIFVQIDGSELLTPVTSTTVVKDGERVTIMIKNHAAIVTGNVSSPSASDNDLQGLGNKITEVEILIADKVSTKEFDAEKGRIDDLVSDNVLIKETLTANEAIIGEVTADNVVIKEKLTANEAEFEELRTQKIDATVADLKYATIGNLEVTDAKVHDLEADYGTFKELSTEKFSANEAEIKELETKKLSSEEAELKYANIDFTNIGKAALEEFFAKSGLIENVVIGDGTITGNLIGVTIKGDLIEGGTIVADKLVIKGSDGLYYKLNTDGITTEAEQTDYNSLNGSIITAKSITATKINVSDLVAFDATIGGFKITDDAIYSGVKESISNTTRGIYMDNDGQVAFGDASNSIKYYRDTDGKYKLVISAESISFSGSDTDLGDEISNIKDKVNSIDGGISVILTKENHTFNGDIDSVDVTQSVTCSIQALKGKEIIPCSIGTITPSTGISIVSDGKLPVPTLTITATTSLTKAGTFLIPINVNGITITKIFSYSIAFRGSNGQSGTSVSVSSTSVLYQASTSGTVMPTGTWATSIPTVQSGQYLWTKTIVSFSDGKSVTSYSISKNGTDGTAGANGSNGSNGVGVLKSEVFYYLSTSNTTQSGGSWTTTVPAWVDGRYYWQKIKTTFTNNTSSECNPVCITGGKGSNGVAGTGVTSIGIEFYLSTSKTTQVGGSWVTTMPTWSTGEYLWTRNKIVYKDPVSTVYTSPICDSSWDAINDIEVGGRNLLLASDAPITNASYPTKIYTMSEKMVAGRVYTCKLWGSLGAGKTHFAIYLDGGSIHLGSMIKNSDGTYEVTFVGKTGTLAKSTIYVYPFASSTSVNSIITKIQLEHGNKSSDYTRAPEDIDKDIDEAAKTATNFMNYDATNGLQLGNKTGGSWAGFRTQITSSAFNILNSAGTLLASYGEKIIDLGKNAADAVINLCGGKGQLRYDGKEDYMELWGKNARIRSEKSASLYAHYYDGKNSGKKTVVMSDIDGVNIYSQRSENIAPSTGIGVWETSSINVNPTGINMESRTPVKINNDVYSNNTRLMRINEAATSAKQLYNAGNPNVNTVSGLFYMQGTDPSLFPAADWYHNIRMQHPGYAAGYWLDLAAHFHGGGLFWRRNNNGSISGWEHLTNDSQCPERVGVSGWYEGWKFPSGLMIIRVWSLQTVAMGAWGTLFEGQLTNISGKSVPAGVFVDNPMWVMGNASYGSGYNGGWYELQDGSVSKAPLCYFVAPSGGTKTVSYCLMGLGRWK